MWDQPLSYWALLVAGNTPVFLAAGWLVFRRWSEFVDCLRLSFTPDVPSLVQGEWMRDFGAEFKLLAFLAGCVLIVALEHVGLVGAGWVGA